MKFNISFLPPKLSSAFTNHTYVLHDYGYIITVKGSGFGIIHRSAKLIKTSVQYCVGLPYATKTALAFRDLA